MRFSSDLICRQALNAPLHVGDKSSQAKLLCLHVHLMQCIQQRVNLLVVHHRDDGRTHTGPGMAAEVGIACLRATSLHPFQIGETTATQTVQQSNDTFEISLIECD